MCHHCVTEAVKQRMLSRRAFLAGAPAAAAGAALAATMPAPPALAKGASTVLDMTHTLSPEFPTFFGEQQVWMDQKFNFADNGFNLFEVRVNEHTGTHMDAPLHFSADGASVDEIPISQLVVPLAIVDIRARAAEDPDAQVTPDDIKAWRDANGDFPEGGAIAMLSGWDAHVASDMYRNADAEGVMHFPGYHAEATEMLLEETGLIGLVVDTLSLDYGKSPDFATHYAWLGSGRWGLECCANLDKLPATGATLIVGGPKVKGGTGGPARVLAMH